MPNGSALGWLKRVKRDTKHYISIVSISFGPVPETVHAYMTLTYGSCWLKIAGATAGLAFLHTRDPPVIHGDLHAVCGKSIIVFR